MQIVDLRQIDLVGDRQFDSLQIACRRVHSDNFPGHFVDNESEIAVTLRQIGDQRLRLLLPLHIQSDNLCQGFQSGEFPQIVGVHAEFDALDFRGFGIDCLDSAGCPVQFHTEAAVFFGQFRDDPRCLILSFYGKGRFQGQFFQAVQLFQIRIGPDFEPGFLKIADNGVHPDDFPGRLIDGQSQIPVTL